jgi:hypothetical protein
LKGSRCLRPWLGTTTSLGNSYHSGISLIGSDANVGYYNSSIDISLNYIPVPENQHHMPLSSIDNPIQRSEWDDTPDASTRFDVDNNSIRADNKSIHEEHPQSVFDELVAVASRRYPTVDRALILDYATNFIQSMEHTSKQNEATLSLSDANHKGGFLIFSTDIRHSRREVKLFDEL